MRLGHIESSHWIDIDPKSGVVTALGYVGQGKNFTINIESEIKLEHGGKDRRNPVGGLEYYETIWENDIRVIGEPYESQTQEGVCWKIPVAIGPTTAELSYYFNRIGPAISAEIRFKGGEPIVVRNLVLNLAMSLGGNSWNVNIPGNGARSNLSLEDLKSSTGVSPMGGLRGSSGLTFFSESSSPRNLALWFDGRVEIPEVEIVGTSKNSAQVIFRSEFCSDLAKVRDVPAELFSIDLSVPQWKEFQDLFQSWLDQSGITSPAAPPSWVKPAMIYEAQLGYSIFGRVNKYSPYPSATDLIADLDRIKSLGFSCIQLMPRQPYPSYNIHDYWDIDTSYGPKAEIKRLVDESHQRGIKVILDVLLHGVLDKESITSAAEGVRNGPYKDRIDEMTYDSFSSDVKDSSNYFIAWSRHIIDFEDSWRDGSPTVSPLIAQHPEWFYRDAAGNVTGVYTKAFDARSSSWQEYFISAMIFLLEELDIDGYRFDAPTYNDFPNWADWASGRANASALACVGLFQKLRPKIKALKPDALMYTEPSGHLLRKSMDLNYNYDEQWLVTSLASPKARSIHGVRSGKELASWMSDRDRFLPRGAMTAHHIDSHDTFWWPSWGIKWRREQFGLEMTQLLTCIFGSLPGPFMMFVGGEEGIETILPKISSFKDHDDYKNGRIQWWIEKNDPDELFAVTYRNATSREGRSMLVNTSDSELRFEFPAWMRKANGEALIGGLKIEGRSILLSAKSAAILMHSEV